METEEIVAEMRWGETFKKYIKQMFHTPPRTLNYTTDYLQQCLTDLYRLLYKLYRHQSATRYARETFQGIFDYACGSLHEVYSMQEDDIIQRCTRIAVMKHHDYGSANILNYGVIGIIVRVGDKLSRLERVMDAKHTVATIDETAIDTLLDTINYSVYAWMLLDNKWDA